VEIRPTGYEMSNAIPYRINEAQSDMRGVKEGWYAMDEEGKLTLGPFSTCDDCLMWLRTVARDEQIDRLRQRLS
jgi:hypothetical protein